MVVRSGILARRLPIAIARVPLAINQDMKAFVSKEDVLDGRYLAYFFDSRASQLLRGSVKLGATVHSVDGGKLEQLSIPLPPRSEQRRIVEILDQAEALRKLRAAADAKAERILPALFYKMFGDPATNPKRLRKKTLGDILTVKSGEFLPAKSMDPAGTYPVYGGNGINGHHSEYMFEDPVIVIGRVGIYCGVVHYSQPRCWVTDNALYVAEKKQDLNDLYLADALRIANLNQYAGRAGQPLISGSRIYPVEILVPERNQQDRYAMASQAVARDSDARAASRTRIEALFSVLLHRAFSGDLTAKWREAHMQELLAEMEQQARALAANQQTPAD